MNAESTQICTSFKEPVSLAYGPGRPRNRGSIPGRGKKIPSSPESRPTLEPTRLHFNGVPGILPGGKAAGVWNLTIHLQVYLTNFVVLKAVTA
jgi:hypothetical protein